MKNIEWQDDRDIYGRMLLLTDSYMFNGLRNAVDHYDADFKDALSWGQLKSKRWLISTLEELDKDLGTIFLCAGWYAILAGMMFESKLKVDKIRSFDIDESCANIADTVNRKYVANDWKFKASTLDIHKMTYPATYTTKKFSGEQQILTDYPNTIINTSCEHILNFSNWYDKIPSQTLCIFQSNNYFEIENHVNCSTSLGKFDESIQMANTLFQGEIELYKYSRYMKIGYK